jgi:uncharacterized OB-fold protein
MAPDEEELWSEEAGGAVLHGMKCAACGVVLFPPQRFGCVACGATPEQLRPTSVPAVGRVHSFAVVNRHHSHPTPYTIAEVELDAGLLVRGLVDDGGWLHVDLRVAGKAKQIEGRPQLVFGPVEGGQS